MYNIFPIALTRIGLMTRPLVIRIAGYAYIHLADYNIEGGTVLHLVLALRGITSRIMQLITRWSQLAFCYMIL